MPASALRLVRPALRPKPIVPNGFLARTLPRPRLGAIGLASVPRSSLVGLSLAGPTRSFSLWPSSKKQQGATESEAALGSTSTSTSTPTPTPSPVPADAAQDAGSGAADTIQSLSSSTTQPIQDVVQAAQSALDTGLADSASDFAAAGLPNGWLTVPYTQRLLEWASTTSGLPWWSVIVGSVVVAKLLLLPIAKRKFTARLRTEAVTPQLVTLQNQVKQAKRVGNALFAARAEDEAKELLVRSGAGSFISFVHRALSFPISLSLFFALRGMANAGLPSMVTGGALWFQDLTLADPYYILPVVTAATQLLMIETTSKPPSELLEHHFRRAIRVVMGLSPLLLQFLPTAVLLMWSSNALWNALQASIFKRFFSAHPIARPTKQKDTIGKKPIVPPTADPRQFLTDALSLEHQRSVQRVRTPMVRKPANVPAFRTADQRAEDQRNRIYLQATQGHAPADPRPVLGKRSARRGRRTSGATKKPQDQAREQMEQDPNYRQMVEQATRAFATGQEHLSFEEKLALRVMGDEPPADYEPRPRGPEQHQSKESPGQ